MYVGTSFFGIWCRNEICVDVEGCGVNQYIMVVWHYMGSCLIMLDLYHLLSQSGV